MEPTEVSIGVQVDEATQLFLVGVMLFVGVSLESNLLRRNLSSDKKRELGTKMTAPSQSFWRVMSSFVYH
jgi:hypothetical protein